jgi:hypothetical protein
MKIDFDVDIDMADRTQILRLVNHTPASIHKDGEYSKHNTGVYFQKIPRFPIQQFSTIDHKQAEEHGWFKVDFLNNGIYTDVRDEAHLDSLMGTEPMWELLEHEEIVNQLFHINRYHHLTQQYKPKNVLQLAMLLAMIRPAKRHLIGLSWNEIETEIWAPVVGEYFFKKAHAVSYAVAITVQLNLLCEKLTSSLD